MAGSQRAELGAIDEAPMKKIAFHIWSDLDVQKSNIKYGFGVLSARKHAVSAELIHNALMIDDMERLAEYAQGASRVDPVVAANILREIEKYKALRELRVEMYSIVKKHGAKVSESGVNIEFADGNDKLEAELKAFSRKYDYVKTMCFPLQYCVDTFLPQLEVYVCKYENSSDTYEIRKREAARELRDILVQAHAAMNVYERAKAGKAAKPVVTPYSVQKQDEFYKRLESLRVCQPSSKGRKLELERRLKDLERHYADTEKFEKELMNLELDFLPEKFIGLANQLSALQREMQDFTNKANESLWTFFRRNPHEGGVWLKELKNSSSLLGGLGWVLNSFAGHIAREQEKIADEKFEMAPVLMGKQAREFLGKTKKTKMAAPAIVADAKSSLVLGKK